MYLIAPFIPLIIGFVYRKRLVSWFARQIGPYIARGVVEWAFVTREVEGEDGKTVQIKAVSEPARGLLAATMPVLISEAAKSIKLKLPTGAQGLPPNLDLSNLSAALPAILSSGMIPKKYAGLVALLAPLAGQFLGGQTAGSGASATTKNPFLKELQP